MLMALGAASSLWDTLQSLTGSNPSSTQSAGGGQTASNPFALSGPAVPATTSAPASGSGGSNQISPQTMSALLDAQSQAGATGSTASQRPSQALNDLFSSIDGNGDGSISQQEFENALGAGGTNLAAADKVFGELDSNKDGSVSLDELKQALQGAGGHHGGHHHHMHAANGSSSSSTDPDNTDPLLQALNSNSSTGSNPTASSLTTVDPSQVTPISLSTATYNMIEKMLQSGTQAYATAPLSVSA
jgi:Ca2+-binding EF-hand superfamily protein